MNSHFCITRLILVLLIIGCTFHQSISQTDSLSQTDPYIKSRYLWNEYKKANEDSVRIRLLSALAKISMNDLDNTILADSISEIAVQIAEKNPDSLIKVIAWNNYIESVELFKYYNKALIYANMAMELCSESEMADWKWRTLHNLAIIHLSRFHFDSAITEGRKGLELAEKLDNLGFMIESYLDIAKCLEGQVHIVEAFRNFHSAMTLSEEINDLQLLKKCYGQLSDFYNLIKTFDKAIEYKRKQQVVLLVNMHPVDSVELMWTWNKMHVILSRYNNLLDKKNIEQVIDFSIRTNNIRLKTHEFALYRKHLIDADKIDELYRVYNIKYPDELKLLSVNDLGMYYKLKAFFKNYERQYDSAYFFFRLAEQQIRTDPNLLIQSNFYIRFGQFLRKIGRTKESIQCFTNAYQLAEADPTLGYMEFMLTASIQLCDLYSLCGDYKNAYHYSEINIWLRDNISRNTNTEQVNRMYLEYKIKLETEKREYQEKQIRNERFIYSGGVVFLLIISLLIYRNYRNQKISNKLLDTAKKKSEDLLLNILPYETAEELKIHGKAKAKRFDEVTVMFTDFKDFTQISEKLSAEDLVDKINFYFSEFDRIITKYGIEKIKIIGDSYMCVGGLPVNNSTHAYDVVNAALELQAFMAEQKSKRMARNESFFELRIGIHTGPVIAGIVGLKKFAYDIWGDTVNTASRMENTGETDKVNISGSTYERIKDRFTCTYRGKVKAKHKGEIDMYFVIPPGQA
jgi:class 3 adenylate cyclase